MTLVDGAGLTPEPGFAALPVFEILVAAAPPRSSEMTDDVLVTFVSRLVFTTETVRGSLLGAGSLVPDVPARSKAGWRFFHPASAFSMSH